MRPSRRQMLPFARRWTEGKPSVTTVLIAVQVMAFTAQYLIETIGRERPWEFISLRDILALSGAGIANGNYWQFGSFILLQAGVVAAVANLLILYFAGRELEPIIGPRHFLTVFLLGNLAGGFVHWLSLPQVALAGTAAGVSALLVAFTTILPELEVTVNLFFALPVRLKAKYLSSAVILVCSIMCAMGTSLEVGPDAMLAGVGVGWLYARRLGFGNPLFFQRYLFLRRQRAAQLERMSPDQFMQVEVDPILEKITRAGLQSLTRAERKILEQGREKISAKSAQL